MLSRCWVLILSGVFSFGAYAIDIGNESTADKADRFDFEEFHKEKGITLWEDKKGGEKKDKKEVTLDSAVKANTASGTKVFEKGQALKLREAYKLGNDPAFRAIQSLYEATEALHKQLNASCPNGWVKEQEWHKPEAGSFYIYYQATCL